MTTLRDRLDRLEGREHFTLTGFMRFARGLGRPPCDCQQCRRMLAGQRLGRGTTGT